MVNAIARPLADMSRSALRLDSRETQKTGADNMDHTFGKLISDQLKLTSHRANLSGVQHQHRITPRDPAPGEPVDLHLVSTSDPAIARAELRYTTDGADPRDKSDSVHKLAFRAARAEWDMLTWDYSTYWTVTIPAQPSGTLVSYCISAWTSAGDIMHADYPDAEARVQHATMIHFENIAPDAPFQPAPQSDAPLFCYHVDGDTPPAWARDAIIYHIFLDRFYPGDGADWIQTERYARLLRRDAMGRARQAGLLERPGRKLSVAEPDLAEPNHPRLRCG